MGMASVTIECTNCGEAGEGDYCAACGQKLGLKRLDLWQLATQLPAQLADLDRGLLFTFVSLFRRPGWVPRDYVRGKRRPYTNPIGYFLLAASLQLIAMSINAPILTQAIEQQLLAAPENQQGPMIRMFGENFPSKIAEGVVSVMQQAYTYDAFVGLIAPFGLFCWLAHRAWKPAYNLAETGVFAMYVISQALIATAIMSLVTVRFMMVAHSFLACGFLVGYATIAGRQFYQSTWRRQLLTWLALMVALAIYVASIAVIFIIKVNLMKIAAG